MKMLCSAIAMAAAAMPLSGAWADCPSFHTLANGTTADASQVMDNFNYILQCPAITGPVSINANVSGPIADIENTGTGAGKVGLLVRASSGNSGDYALHVLGSASKEILFASAASGNIGIATTSPSQTFYVNGTAGGTNAWVVTSDARLKKNIVSITGALAIIDQLRGVRFEWKSPGERGVGKDLNLPIGDPQVGFIAQEVQKVLPEAVAVDSGKDSILELRETKIIPVLVEAVKELSAQNKAEQARIAKLEDELAQLRKAPSRTADLDSPAKRTPVH